MPLHNKVKVNISRERIEKLRSLGCADYIHIALLERIEELESEIIAIYSLDPCVEPTIVFKGMMFWIKAPGAFQGTLPKDAVCLFKVIGRADIEGAIVGMVTYDPESDSREKLVAIPFGLWPTVAVRQCLHRPV